MRQNVYKPFNSTPGSVLRMGVARRVYQEHVGVVPRWVYVSVTTVGMFYCRLNDLCFFVDSNFCESLSTSIFLSPSF